jgi:hypothetical protein
MPAMESWLATARRPAVMRRALGYAVVVGAILIAINHGGAIVRGEMDASRVLQMGLTVLVPYTVSTLSSVSALRGVARDG